ncbi:MAG TPA: hypothetical protein ENK33_08425 [Desulfobacterales bacterium]|nr:hypothetical protein [Desulfobacterales bacterium]
MIYVDIKEDRRVFSRLALKDSALVMTSNFMGLINDLSLGGLAFSYCHKGALPVADTALEIIIAHDTFTMAAGQFEIVDNNTVGNKGVDWSILVGRLRFCNLDGGKFMRLWHFIKRNCTFDSSETDDIVGNGIISHYDALPSVSTDLSESLINDRV